MTEEERRRLVVAVDVDGVLADQVTHTFDRAKAEYGVEMSRKDMTSWNPKVGPSTFVKLIERYLLDPEWTGSMPTIEGAEQGIRALREIADMIIASTIPPESSEIRMNWLRKKFAIAPPFFNTWKSGKSGIPADVLVDDNAQNLHDFVAASPARFGIMFSQPWNKGSKNGERIAVARDWEHVIEIIREIARHTENEALKKADDRAAEGNIAGAEAHDFEKIWPDGRGK